MAGARGLAMPDGVQDVLVNLPFRGSICEGREGDLFASTSEGGDTVPCPTLRDVLQSHLSPFAHDEHQRFTSDSDRVELQSVHFASRASAGSQARLDELARSMTIAPSAMAYMRLPSCAIRAGPRETIYHTPSSVQMAIVTVGGLCPGLNDVVRGIVLKALDYGVSEKHILGIRYGFKGFYCKKHRPITLDRRAVDSIQLEGGTMLGTSRDRADVREIVKRLDLWKIDHLYVIGGPGGHAGALAIQRECERCRVDCCIISIPKSIDNDILLVDKTFGFETAVEEAQNALLAAKVEATSGYRGVGLVKLMGRRSGFIAVQASMASGLVDVCLIPEVPFRLDSVTAYLEAVLERHGHAVVCIAEGAAQELMEDVPAGLDASGKPESNPEKPATPALKDVGLWLRKHLKKALHDVDVKYIDPSYLIRSVPARSNDRVYCRMLAHGAVHAAFAGYTGITVGLVNTHFVYLPIPLVIQATRVVDPNGEMWNRLRGVIAQPDFSEPPPLPGSLVQARSSAASVIA